jgi:S-methylmethionine-dependent homocysteine/selenocysteine methylase
MALWADPESPELVSMSPLTLELDCISVLTLDLLEEAEAILPLSSALASLQSFISWSMFYFWS